MPGMFIYLSKKIAIPNNVKLKCISYNQLDGYIACGGESCLLKVLKLEAKEANAQVRGLAANSTLTMNQPLEGHKGPVTVLAWNEKHHKLTSGDQNGLIIVWMLHKGGWYEEMVNNRSKSVVRSIKWNGDGGKICIAYEDGAVILGTVDGNRVWGKELKTQLTHLEWSPNGRNLLFATAAGEINIHDANGEYVSKIPVLCQKDAAGRGTVAAMEWYNGSHGYWEQDCPCLAICFTNGRCQFMRGENDEEPVLLNTGLNLVTAKWNFNGSMLAIGGQAATDKEAHVIYFYSPVGEHLKSLKLSGKELTSLSWEFGGLRLAATVDSYIYFANIRPDYKWAYFADTVVYTYTKPEQTDCCVTFWNTKNNEKYVKYIKNLLMLTACGDYCCIVTRSDDVSVPAFTISLYNSIGTSLDAKHIDLLPVHIAMTGNHVVIASREAFYMWQFKNVKQKAIVEASNRMKAGTERLYHVDDIPSGVGGDTVDFSKANLATQDPICAICISDKLLLIARESGSVNQHTMPSLSLTNKLTIRPRAAHISLNCNSSRLAVIEPSSALTLLNIDNGTVGGGGIGLGIGSASQQSTPVDVSKFERKDVWNLKWAEDNPDMFAVMEKMKLCVFNGIEPEVKSVHLDEIMLSPDKPSIESVVLYESKSLRDTRNLLETQGLEEAVKFAEANSNQQLWRLLAEVSLEKLNLKVAEHAFVRCKDYAGIQFVKRLGYLHNDNMKRGEIAAYFGRFEESEKVYIDLDRKDLAVSLRKKLGDWFQVLQLLKTSSAGDDHQMEETCNAIGNFFADRQQWSQAVPYFEKGRNKERLAKCYYMLEDYDGLKKLTDQLPENDRLLQEIAEMFVTVGMCQEAVDAYVKCNKVQLAIDACVTLNQWKIAIDLAHAHHVREVDTLLVKYAETLLQKNKTFDAIELYRKANHFLDAAKLLFKLAQSEVKQHSHPLRIKKLFLLAALLVEQYHNDMRNTQRAKTKKRGAEAASALAGLLEEDMSAVMDTKVIDGAWRGAEAYHLYLLAQRQLYEGHYDAALRTACHLQHFEDTLDPANIYSLLAIAASAAKAFQTCSFAMTKLECMENLSEDQRHQYEELSTQLFTNLTPKDLKVAKVSCPNCATTIPDTSTMCSGCQSKFPTCMVTGRSLFDSQYWMCPTCKHSASPADISARRTCPLCHSPTRG